MFDHFQFTLIHGLNILSPYAILFFTASDFSYNTSHIHNWVLFSFGSTSSFFLELFFDLSQVARCAPSNLRSSSFSHIFLPFQSVHGVLKARVLKRLAIPFSSVLCFLRTLYHYLSILGGPIWHGS